MTKPTTIKKKQKRHKKKRQKLGGPVFFLALKTNKQTNKNCYLLRQLLGEMSYDSPMSCARQVLSLVCGFTKRPRHTVAPRASLPRCAALPSPFLRREARRSARLRTRSLQSGLAVWPDGPAGRVEVGAHPGWAILVVTRSFSWPCFWATWGCVACEALFSDVARDGGLTLYCDFVHEDLFVTGCFCYIAHPPLFPELCVLLKNI